MRIKEFVNYFVGFLKWMVLAIGVGVVGGAIGTAFHKCLEEVADIWGLKNNWLIFLLPVGGLVIVFLYRMCKRWGKLDTNRVILAAREKSDVPLVQAPLIYVSTIITHLLGGSAGREGAALQLGGSIGYNMGRLFRLDEYSLHIIVMAGMSSVFAALFGTPLTAAVFAFEVVSVGIVRYAALVPCVIASVVAYNFSCYFGSEPVKFVLELEEVYSAELLGKVVVLAGLCALVSILFCMVLHKSEIYMKKLLPNDYLRVFVGALVIIALTYAVGSREYNGAGMNIIERAMNGNARWEAFLLKMIFTAITIGAGFKGGEIVPTFFVGSTFGCVLGGLLGLDPSFGAAIGFVALFCGVVNCPIASIFLAFEVFGGEGYLFFAIACGISFMLSGNYGLYKSQKITFSKIDGNLIDVNTK